MGDRIENVLVGLAEEGWEDDEGRMAVRGGREALRNALGLIEPGGSCGMPVGGGNPGESGGAWRTIWLVTPSPFDRTPVYQRHLRSPLRRAGRWSSVSVRDF